MKYKIEVFGRGLDTFIYQITDEQHEKWHECDVEEDCLTIDEIYEILKIESFSDTNETILGIINGSYHGEYLTIVVKDENDEVVWESSETFDFEEIDEKYDYNDGHFLAISDYQKGLFFIGDLEIDTDFDPALLCGNIVDALEGKLELITGLKYDGQQINLDYGDTSSKGFNFYLI